MTTGRLCDTQTEHDRFNICPNHVLTVQVPIFIKTETNQELSKIPNIEDDYPCKRFGRILQTRVSGFTACHSLCVYCVTRRRLSKLSG